MLENPANDLASGTASAPGDLPWPAIAKREADKAKHFRHDNSIEPVTPRPDEAVAVSATSGARLSMASAHVSYTTDGSQPGAESSRITMDRGAVTWTPTTGYLDTWTATIPAQPEGTVVRYTIVGTNADGAEIHAHDGSGFWFTFAGDGLTTFAYRVSDAPYQLPGWFRDATTYHVIVDRFAADSAERTVPGSDDPTALHGGTLAGITRALPHLEALGITCLWLSPIGPSSTYHRYDQTSYFDVDEAIGGIDAANALISAAHERGMRVILDFVPSHASWAMPEFKAAQADQEAPTASWFTFEEWPDTYRCFLGVVPFLVSLDGNDPGLRQHLIDSAVFWLTDVGFDGLRLDHSIGHGTDFWIAFSDAVLAARPDAAIFGEATDTPNMLRRNAGVLQGVLDFPLANMLRLAIATGDMGVDEFSSSLDAYMRYMEDGPDRVIFLDNHDMNRFLFLADDDVARLRIAATVLLTLPFSPVLYYGTEIGLSQAEDKDAAGFGGDHVLRPDMPWDTSAWDEDLLAFVSQAIAIRTETAALRRGTWVPGKADATRGTYFYSIASADDRLTVCLNLSDSQATVDIGAGREVVLATSGGVATAAVGVVLPPLSAAVLR